MRSIAALIGAVFLGLAPPAVMTAAQAREKLHCESQPAAGDTRDISCQLKASGTVQHFHFKAKFAGGHDDTVASMTATFNGVPLTCEKGSKTSLMGEDGEVSLECRFSMNEKPDTEHVLRVGLLWSHAQYTDFEFDSD